VANVTAVIGLAGRFAGEATIEDLWRELGADPGGGAGGAGGSGVAGGSGETARLFQECAADVLQGVAWADRTGLFLRGVPGASGVPGAEADGVAAAVAGALGLHGPAVDVDGPALAAVERACRELLGAECDLALAGEAPVRGDGAAVVALKRLPAALADGDSILAVIERGAVHALMPPPAAVPQARRDPAGLDDPSTVADSGAPAPLRDRPQLAGPYAPPANPLEAAIAGVWQEELGIAQVGVEDNFFELGGTSIAGVKIIALLKEWLHQDIPTVSLYEGPTVRALAQVLLHSGPAKGYDAMRERGERRRRKLQRLQGLARAEE
jgi:acyl carrier protein